MSFGITELAIILVIVLLLFGTTKLKSLGSDLGSAIKGFKSAISDDKGVAPEAGAEAKSEAHDEANTPHVTSNVTSDETNNVTSDVASNETNNETNKPQG